RVGPSPPCLASSTSRGAPRARDTVGRSPSEPYAASARTATRRRRHGGRGAPAGSRRRPPSYPLMPAPRSLLACAAPGRPFGEVRRYAAGSDESVIVADLLVRHVPALARGDVELAAIARRPGVLTKVAVRWRSGVRLSARPVTLVVGPGADYGIA